MHIKWGDRRRYWVELWNADTNRYDTIKSKEAPSWVRKEAFADEDRRRIPSVRCIHGGGLYFRPGEGDELVNEFRLDNPKWVGANRLRKAGRRIEMPERWVYPAGRLPIDHPWAHGLILPRFATYALAHATKSCDEWSARMPNGEVLRNSASFSSACRPKTSAIASRTLFSPLEASDHALSAHRCRHCVR